jgi:ribosome maturation factor RimP
MITQVRDTVVKLIEETANRLGYMIYESSFLYKGENSQIHVKIDSLAGISHLDCEKFSRELSALLDGDESVPNYSLEVSSPGLNRALRGAGEFKRFAGAPVKVVYDEGTIRKVAKGVIEGATDSDVSVSSGTERTVIAYDTIIHANLDY